MRDELQRWLDGEIGDEALPEELRGEAERLRALFDTQRPVGPAPRWVEGRVMRGIPRREPGLLARTLDAVVRPRTLRVRPITVASLAAAALAALLLLPLAPAPVPPEEDDGPVRTVATRGEDGRVHVQFVYIAPDAGAVAVAGDFNEWSDRDFQLRDPDGDGVWTGRLALSPGLHKYMFVVDGRWVADPLAERYVDDGFGNRNALIDVTPTGSAI